MANLFEGATGWQSIDLGTGAVIGGGTFGNVTPQQGPAFNPGSFYDAFGGTFGATSAKPATLFGGGAAAGSGKAPVAGAPTATVANAASDGVTTNAGYSPGIAPGSVADFFARAVLVILGFIFVATGLYMLKPAVLQVVR